MGIFDKAGERARHVQQQLKQSELFERLSGKLPQLPTQENVAFEGTIPNPLGDGSLLKIAVGIRSEEDAGGERMRLIARVQTPLMQVLAAEPHRLKLSYDAPQGKVPALLKHLPGGEKALNRYSLVKAEVASRLPALQPTGEEVTTVFDIDMNRKKAVITEGAKGLVPRLKERFAVMAGPENWHVEQQEEMVDGGFRGMMTIRNADKNSPVDVVAKVGVELRRKDD